MNSRWKERKLGREMREREREESRLNRVKASPEDRRRIRALFFFSRAPSSSSPSGDQVQVRATERGALCIARKDANTLRMDSSATVKGTIAKGSGGGGGGGGGPSVVAVVAGSSRSVFRKRILCCGRKINNGRAAFRSKAGGWVAARTFFSPPLLLLVLRLLFFSPRCCCWLSSLRRRLARIFCLLDK